VRDDPVEHGPDGGDQDGGAHDGHCHGQPPLGPPHDDEREREERDADEHAHHPHELVDHDHHLLLGLVLDDHDGGLHHDYGQRDEERHGVEHEEDDEGRLVGDVGLAERLPGAMLPAGSSTYSPGTVKMAANASVAMSTATTVVELMVLLRPSSCSLLMRLEMPCIRARVCSSCECTSCLMSLTCCFSSRAAGLGLMARADTTPRSDSRRATSALPIFWAVSRAVSWDRLIVSTSVSGSSSSRFMICRKRMHVLILTDQFTISPTCKLLRGK
jgi:hypothetical protein